MKKKLLIGGIIGGVTLLAATPVALTITGVVDIPVINKIVSNDAKKVNNKKKDNTDKTEDKKDNQNNTDSSSDTNDLDLYKKVIVKEEEKFDESKCKEIKFEKQERKPISDEHSINNSTYDEFIDSYISALDQWNYYDLRNLTYTHSFTGSQKIFDEMDGYVVSAKVLRDETNEKLLKLKFDISKPGKSNLKNSTNEKYVYIIKTGTNWYASPMFDNLGDIERSITFKKSDSTIIACWDEAVNGGFGFKDINDYYKNGIFFSRSVEIDLNNDGKKETISIEKPQAQLDYENGVNLWDEKDIFQLGDIQREHTLENTNGNEYDSDFSGDYTIVINKGKDNEVKATWGCSFPNLCYCIADIDSTDNFKELIFSGSETPNDAASYIYRYDGKSLNCLTFSDDADDLQYDNTPIIDTDSITGDNTVIQSRFSNYLCSLDFKIKSEFKNNSFVLVKDQWAEIFPFDRTLQKKLTVYENPDLSSAKTTINANNKIILNRFKFDDINEFFDTNGKTSAWVEITYNEKTYYMHCINYDTIDNNGSQDTANEGVFVGNCFAG